MFLTIIRIYFTSNYISIAFIWSQSYIFIYMYNRIKKKSDKCHFFLFRKCSTQTETESNT